MPVFTLLASGMLHHQVLQVNNSVSE